MKLLEQVRELQTGNIYNGYNCVYNLFISLNFNLGNNFGWMQLLEDSKNDEHN